MTSSQPEPASNDTNLPAPMVPSDCDLRDFPYMPMDITRLFGSEFHALSTDAGWRAGVTLWLKSYHQVPAASLPDDDVGLARLAELGRDQKAWRRVRGEALHGWVLCRDGRLYHPVVATKALEAWLEKSVLRKASAAANAKRWSQCFDPEPFDDAIEDAAGLLRGLHPQSKVLSKVRPRSSDRTSDRSSGRTSDRTTDRTPDGNPTGTPTGTPNTPLGGILSEEKRSKYPSQEGGTSEQNNHVGVVPLRAGGSR